jgi:hypothetical protein
MEKTISTMIWEVINDISSNKGNYDPATLSSQLITLSTLYANLTEKIAEFEYQYQGVVGLALDKDPDKPYNKIENECKRSEEHYRLKKAQALEKAVIQIIRSTNKFIRIKENEQSVARYQ